MKIQRQRLQNRKLSINYLIFWVLNEVPEPIYIVSTTATSVYISGPFLLRESYNLTFPVRRGQSCTK